MVFGEVEKFLSEELIELWLLNSRTAEVEQGIRNGNLRRFDREMLVCSHKIGYQQKYQTVAKSIDQQLRNPYGYNTPTPRGNKNYILLSDSTRIELRNHVTWPLPNSKFSKNKSDASRRSFCLESFNRFGCCFLELDK